MFRPYRDVRFSKDKSPYKTAAAAASETQGGASLYVHLSASGLFVGSGYYHMAADQLARFRDALDDDARARPSSPCAALEKKGTSSRPTTSSRRPRGYPKDHPRIDYLLPEGSGGRPTFPVAVDAHTQGRGPHRRGLAAQAPMNEWLGCQRRSERAPPEDQEW